MYKYTDSVIKWINHRIVILFNSSRRLIKQDELNVIEGSKTLYSELMKMLVYAYLKISKRAYRRAGGPDERAISTAWLMKNLRDYDPVTGYVFTREVSRKRDRMAEGIISQRSIDGFLKAERLFCLMAAQYAIEATDNATMQAYQDQGVKKVRWVTEGDSKVCKTCKERNGKIYDINKVPEKPHINCRCYLVPVKK